MREKLADLIAGTKYGKDLRTTVGANFQRIFIERIADHLIANGVTVQRWIPVAERLPEAERIAYQEKYNTDEPVEVLVMIEGATEPTALFYGGWGSFFDFVGDETIFYPVTSWQPLPDAPKEE